MPQLVEFDVGPDVLTLHADDELNIGRAGIGTVAYWTTSDVDRAVAVCVARGGTVHRGPKTVFSGDRLCQFLDPFGNLLGLRSPNRKGTHHGEPRPEQRDRSGQG